MYVSLDMVELHVPRAALDSTKPHLETQWIVRHVARAKLQPLPHQHWRTTVIVLYFIGLFGTTPMFP